MVYIASKNAVFAGPNNIAGGWGAQRAQVYAVPEDELGAYYAQRHWPWIRRRGSLRSSLNTSLSRLRPPADVFVDHLRWDETPISRQQVEIDELAPLSSGRVVVDDLHVLTVRAGSRVLVRDVDSQKLPGQPCRHRIECNVRSRRLADSATLGRFRACG
ncbi:MAG TPA: hypothetical protein VIW24_09090 [Aldersonia sp.]